MIVVGILNAGRNSLSFFLLLIVAMGLSVVHPSLGVVMNRVRLLTILHFVFGGEFSRELTLVTHEQVLILLVSSLALYAIGIVQVQLETASLFIVLFLIFPLALTLTAFLMWTIVSLNGMFLNRLLRFMSFVSLTLSLKHFLRHHHLP